MPKRRSLKVRKRRSKAVRKSSKAVRKSRVRKSRKVSRKSGKKRKSGKRKLNAYFKAMLAAKKSNAPDFSYNGKKYVQKAGKNGMVFYKRA
jgi:hypothetical protein